MHPLQPCEARAVRADDRVGIEIRALDEHGLAAAVNGDADDGVHRRRAAMVFAHAQQALTAGVHGEVGVVTSGRGDRRRRATAALRVHALVGKVDEEHLTLMHGVGARRRIRARGCGR